MNEGDKNIGCLLVSIFFLGGLYFVITEITSCNIDLDRLNVGRNIDLEQNMKEIERREFYGRQVFPISKREYFKRDSLVNYKSKVSSSNIKSINGKIIISTERKPLIFKNNIDKKCMSCVQDYSVVGQVESLQKVIIESGYFRHVEFQIVDLESSEIDTIPDYPSFSPSMKYMVSNAFNSKDTIYGGLNIYTIYNRNINLMGKRGEGKWIADEIFWTDDKTIYARIVRNKDGDYDWGNYEYVKIDLNYF